MKPPPSWGFNMLQNPQNWKAKPSQVLMTPVTLTKTNIFAPETGWLEYLPVAFRPIFKGRTVSFRERTVSAPLPVVFLHVVCQKIKNTNMGKHKLYKLTSLNQKTKTQDVSKPKKIHRFLFFFGLQKIQDASVIERILEAQVTYPSWRVPPATGRILQHGGPGFTSPYNINAFKLFL